jgi:KDO2-lipid IV(A) lauroyltransferase
MNLPRWQDFASRLGAQALVALMWLLHWLPLPVLAALGRALGSLLWRVARSRRKVAMANIRLCFPDWSEERRLALGLEHFQWLSRSLLERSLTWFASDARLHRMVRVEGDVTWAERTGERVMWLVPHFVGLDFAGPGLMLNQTRAGVDVYQRQSNPVFDAGFLKARGRYGRSTLVERSVGVRPVLRAIEAGAGFVNAPDMDFGIKDSAFVPFFGVPACTLLSPARMVRTLKMHVQPIIMLMLPGGQGYVARFCEPPPGFDHPDPLQATAALNLWLEGVIREHPAQYFWVHRRFKTRPPGESGVY